MAMIQISEASILKLIVHRVGNKLRDEGLDISTRTVDFLSDDLTPNVLMHYFFSQFKGDSFYNFDHPSSLALNAIYRTAATIFDSDKDFAAASEFVANYLYDVSNHPNIKQGELYVVLFNNVIVESEVCDAIGIFKSESSQTFINVRTQKTERYVVTVRGVNPTKLDKGCLIFNSEREAGFKLCVIDNTSNNGDAVYWKESFLHVKPRNDSYYQTRSYMEVCKGFVKEVFNSENEVDRTDQVAMLNKTAAFFRTNEVFNQDVFENEVMQQPEIIEAFKEYKDKYETTNQVTFIEEFCIAPDVAKKMVKSFKSVIKLDKNFQVYINGDSELVEKGYDKEKGMSFYKLFFNTETV